MSGFFNGLLQRYIPNRSLLLAAAIGLISVLAAPPGLQAAGESQVRDFVNSTITCMAVRPDGCVVMGGSFTTAGAYARNQLALLNPAGEVDANFNPVLNRPTGVYEVLCAVACVDKKTLVGGTFWNGAHRGIVRLNEDGTTDATFNATVFDRVSCISLQSDGRIVISGTFTQVNGVLQPKIARLNTDGSLDPTFTPAVTGDVRSAMVLSSGKILIGGNFDSINGAGRTALARLLPDGALDTTFTATGFISVDRMLEQGNGDILVAGNYKPTGDSTALGLVRISSTGVKDDTFPGTILADKVNQILLQADGKIIVAGSFTSVGPSGYAGIVRLSKAGAIDPTFSATFGGIVYSAAMQADGKVWIGGYLDSTTAVRQHQFYRAANDAATVSMEIDGTTSIRLLAGGAAPSFRNVIFDLRDPVSGDWQPIAAASPVTGGYQASGLGLPAGGILRCRAEGSSSQSSSLAFATLKSYGATSPKIAVRQSTGELLENGATFQFSPSLTGLSSSRNVIISNEGTGLLENFSFSFSNNPSSFFSTGSVLIPQLFPGQSAALELRAGGGTVGNFTATLSISSNSVEGNPYVLTLGGSTGKVYTPTFYSASDLPLSAPSLSLSSYTFGGLNLAYAPLPLTKLVAAHSTGTAAISGRFSNLADGEIVSADFGGITYQFMVGYAGGANGSDLVLSLLGPGLPDLEFRPKLSGTANVALPDSGGSLIVGGNFSTVNSQSRPWLARLSATGQWLTDFAPTLNNSVVSIHRLSSGKYLVAGTFTAVGGSAVNRIARLNADGIYDSSFSATVNGVIRVVAVQGDGKILIGGDFSSVNGVPRNRMARLNPNGSLDLDFNPNLSAAVYCITLQDDGKILVGGVFGQLGGSPGIARSYIARLEASGAVDPAFNIPLSITSSTGSVLAIAVQADRSIIFGGAFDQINNAARPFIARVSQDGVIDASFNPAFNALVDAIAIQADGKILVGGKFTAAGSELCNRFARLNSDGSLDPSISGDFAGASVNNLAIQEDGAIIATGGFTIASGVEVPGLVRIKNTPVVSDVTIEDSDTLRWMRGGSAPEASQVSFEILKMGSGVWEPLGNAARISGGWELAGVTLPTPASIRSRSRISSANVSYEILSPLISLGTPLPQLVVRDPSGAQLTSSGPVIDLGSIPLSLTRNFNVELANLGISNLSGITVSLSGSSDFTIVTSPSGTLAPEQIGKLMIRYLPMMAGPQSAILQISSNDPAVPLFTISLSAIGQNQFAPHFRSATDSLISAVAPDVSGWTFGGLILDFAPPIGTILKGIDNTSASPINGVISGLPEGYVVANFEGRNYEFYVSYRGGNGNDLTFSLVGPGNPYKDFAASAGSSVHSIAVQPDGTFYVSGEFTALGGQSHQRIARILPNGSVDPSFQLKASDRAEAMAITREGKLLVGTTLTTPEGVVRKFFARLNHDGSLDTSFSPDISSTVLHVMELKDGRIFIGGYFVSVNGVPRMGLAILNADGSLDTSFTCDASKFVGIYGLEQQDDGKLLIAGSFTISDGIAGNYLVRLNLDGTVDETFNPNPGSAVSSLAVQPDGKILVGGYFTAIAGVSRKSLVRLKQDGTIDDTFVGTTDNSVTSILVQNDGRILISGLFTTVNGTSQRAIARLLPSGNLDPTFNVIIYGANPLVYVLGMLPNGRILAGGSYSSIQGGTSSNLASLGNDPVQTSLEIGASDLTWWRSGSLLAMRRAVFEISNDSGVSWSVLGEGSRFDGGWKLTGANFPVSGYVRAIGGLIASSRSSNVASEMRLFGRSLTALEAWRQSNFGSPLNDGVAADRFDADHDGIQNLVEYAFAFDPKADSSGLLPYWTSVDGDYEISFEKPAGVDGVTYGAEWSMTLDANDWHAASDISLGASKIFRVPALALDPPRLFMRLKVSNP